MHFSGKKDCEQTGGLIINEISMVIITLFIILNAEIQDLTVVKKL
jgi:hypothetical protein